MIVRTRRPSYRRLAVVFLVVVAFLTAHLLAELEAVDDLLSTPSRTNGGMRDLAVPTVNFDWQRRLSPQESAAIEQLFYKPAAETEAQAEAAPVEPDPLPDIEYELKAVILSDERSWALVLRPPGADVTRVVEGDQFDGWTVSSIDSNSVRLVSAVAERILFLPDSRPR